MRIASPRQNDLVKEEAQTPQPQRQTDEVLGDDNIQREIEDCEDDHSMSDASDSEEQEDAEDDEEDGLFVVASPRTPRTSKRGSAKSTSPRKAVKPQRPPTKTPREYHARKQQDEALKKLKHQK
jgi:hypothetical protein